MFKVIKDWWIDFITRKVLKFTPPDRVFKIIQRKNGQAIQYKGRVLDPELTAKLAEEAIAFKDSSLWKLVKHRLEYQIKQDMFQGSADMYDLRIGKIGLLIIDRIEKLLDKLAGV